LTTRVAVGETDSHVRKRTLRPRAAFVKPAPFELHQPATTAETAQLLGALGDEVKPLAGGQSLVPMLALRLTRFEHLVDLNGVDELARVEQDGSGVRIGATVRQAEVARNALIAERAPLLATATALIGHAQIRNRGTIGGSVAHADPASEYPAVVLALDATIEVTRASGTWQVPAADFFTGTWTTALESDELLSAIIVPPRPARRGEAIEEVARRNGDFALAGAVAVVDLHPDDRIERAAISLFGMGSTPLRAADAEAALAGTTPSDDDLREIAAMAVAATDPPADVHASAEYRRRVATHLVARVVRAAQQEATRAPR
jgi:carbon-monoxide dehydrogenase medium subunit